MRYPLRVLFLCNLCLWSMGNGLLPLLPVYALERGATPATAGAALACAYGAVALSNLLASALAGVLRSRKRLLVAGGLLSVLPTALLGSADTLWQLVALLSTVWFCAGLAAAMIHVLTGVYADANRRGRQFSLVMLAMPLGAVIGAPALGALASRLGYQTMFAALALLALLWSLLALVALPGDRFEPVTRAGGAQPPAGAGDSSPAVVRLLLGATLLASVTTFIGRLATSLAMRALAFDLAAIGGAMAVGALASLPLLPLIGALSDRLGRRRFLGAAYLLGGIGTLSLAFAQALWQFWLASALLSLAVTVSAAVISALAADLLPARTLTGALPRIMAMGWVAAVIGFAAGGYLLERLDLLAVAAIAAGLAAIAAGLLSRLPTAGGASGRPAHVPAPMQHTRPEA